jgi:hypothetical protein
VGCLAVLGALPAQMPHANAQKAHIAPRCGRRSSHESSHGQSGRPAVSVTVSDADCPGRTRVEPPERHKELRVRRLGCPEHRDLGCYASVSAPKLACRGVRAGYVVWSGSGLQRPSSQGGRDVAALTPVGQLPQPGPVAGQRRLAVAGDAGHWGGCAGVAAGCGWWPGRWSSGSMARMMRRPISRSCRDWVLVSGSKTRRRTSWT